MLLITDWTTADHRQSITSRLANAAAAAAVRIGASNIASASRKADSVITWGLTQKSNVAGGCEVLR